jgi:ketosteroid isomerase-like protein
MARTKYAAFQALDPFFEIIQQGLAGLVDGEHFFDAVADDAVFEFLYEFPGLPRRLRGRAAYMDQFSGYGDVIKLHSSDGLVAHRSVDPRVVILEYEVHGKVVATAVPYDNRFISVITIEHKKIVRWRDYMDSLAAMNAMRR